MALQYLLLGHLIGDFLFQTDKLALHKTKFIHWNLLHAAIVTLCTLFFAIPLGETVFLLVLINGALHYVIDWFKPRLTKQWRISGLAAFLIDQAIHLLLLAGISLLAQHTFKPILFDDGTWSKILIVLFVTTFGGMLNQFILTSIFPRKGKPLFAKGEKYLGMLLRLLMCIGLFLAWYESWYFLFLTLAFIVLAFFIYNAGMRVLTGSRQVMAKLLLDLGMSLCAILMLVIIL